MLPGRAPGAALRALAAGLLVALPQLLVGHPSATSQLSMIVAVLAALFVFSEYAARVPSIVEFRDARPYHRLRAAAFAAAVLVCCLELRADWAGVPVLEAVRAAGAGLADLLRLPWSPVRLFVAALPEGVPPELVRDVAAMAATAYALSLAMVLAFGIWLRRGRWPGRARFNVWVNLPQFDPTRGGDVVARLHQNALANVALGLLLPLALPIVLPLGSAAFDGPRLRDPAALVWVVTLWAFVPANLAMRGLALHRLARLLAARRHRLALGASPQPA